MTGWQWASMNNGSSLKLKQLNGIQPSLVLVYINIVTWEEPIRKHIDILVEYIHLSETGACDQEISFSQLDLGLKQMN